MNCQSFEAVVADLSRDRLMVVAARERALEHASLCEACAAQLASARLLARSLRIAASAETERAPDRVKQALLAAFAEQVFRQPAPRQASGQSLNPAARRWVWAAAAILAVLALAGLRIFSGRTPAQPELAGDAQKAAQPAPNWYGNKPAKDQPASPGEQPRKIATPTPVRQTPKRTRTSPTAAEKTEVATDYIALTYLDGATAMETGQVVRVSISRSTLISMGMPVDVERAGERVKADVVLGDDGVARAIRFVY